MAVKPIISTIIPWDTTVGTNIAFSYSGNLPVTAKGIIKNASTLETRWTYEETVIRDNDGRYLFYIAPNTLKANSADVDGNGNKYSIQLIVTDNEGNISPISDKEYFWCFETPQCYYNKPNYDEVIGSPNIELELVYSQSNGEKIYSYRHYLYDNSRNLVVISDHFYDETGFSYIFRGLDNKTSYYIRTQGITKNGMPVDTGYLRIFTDYGTPEVYSILGLESDANATVYGHSNMICIDADEDDEDYIFINSLVQVIRKKITYQTNYTIARDFTLQLKFTKVLFNGLLLKMYNKEYPDYTITIDSYYFYDNLIRYCLKVFNGLATYVLYTDGLELQNDDYVVLTLRRVNNAFSFTAQKVEETD